jgi:uncharacterized membrane protein
MRDLGAEVAGAGRSQAAGINDINEVVGTVNGRAFLARDGLSYELGVLPGHASSDARAINNKGQVVETLSPKPASPTRSCGILARCAASVRCLETAPVKHRPSTTTGMSSDARLRRPLGFSSRDLANGVALDLNRLISSPGWVLSSATGINDRGQIVGAGLRDGQLRAFLLNAR